MAIKISKKSFETVILPALSTEDLKLCYEAYGRKVSAYLSTPATMSRVDFEKALESKGCRVNRSYWPGSKRVEVSNISFFKATGWDQ